MFKKEQNDALENGSGEWHSMNDTQDNAVQRNGNQEDDFQKNNSQKNGILLYDTQ